VIARNDASICVPCSRPREHVCSGSRRHGSAPAQTRVFSAPALLFTSLLLALAALPGCFDLDAAPPAQQLTPVPTRDAFSQTQPSATQPANVDNWLTQFNDPALTELVHEAIAHNPNLAQYAAQRDEIVARLNLARSYLMPQADAFANLGKVKTNQGPSYNNVNAGVSVSWEADLWGRIRYASRAAEQDVLVAESDYTWARYLLASQVAQAWYLAISADLQRAVDQDLLNVQEKTLRITKGKVWGQQSTRLDLELATANVNLARDAIQRSNLAYQNAVRSLEQLLGRYPATELKTAANLPEVPLTGPVGIPSQLLERRPDVIAADRAVASAFNRIGSAKAAKLPALVLTGSLGYALDPSSLIWSIGANLLAPIYHGGALDAQVQITQAQQRAALARYVEVGIRAFGEVENALAAGTTLAARQIQLQETQDHLAKASHIAQRRYDAGELSIFDLNQVRIQYFNSRGELIRVKGERLRQSISLYLALGGSYDQPAPTVTQPDTQPTTTQSP
jgi:outer membrane protein, multidrug efflux system